MHMCKGRQIYVTYSNNFKIYLYFIFSLLFVSVGVRESVCECAYVYVCERECVSMYVSMYISKYVSVCV